MSVKPKLLLFYNYPSTFLKRDIELLQDDYDIHGHDFYIEKKWQLPFRFITQFYFLLRHAISANMALCQFGGYSSLMPVIAFRLMGKKVFVIVGGTEGHYFPGIGYGSSRGLLNKIFVWLSLKYCTRILPKHQALISSEYTYDTREPRLQGIYNIYHIKTPYTVIPNGFNGNAFFPQGERKPKSFATIANGWHYPFQVQLKGIDLFVEAARTFPQYNFTIIGVTGKGVIDNLPANLTLMPQVPNKDLSQILSGFEFYTQLSMAEGFPNSLAEAMLCGCIPIVSDAFSMPDIIRDSGFVLPHRDKIELTRLIEEAVVAPNKDELSQKARKRILDNYTLQYRKDLLLAALAGK